jgi:CDP-diacylglycerol---serine O-phosphatidyltransferase
MSDPPEPADWAEAAPAEPATPRVRRGIYLLPNLLTTGTLFAGFYAIVAAIDGNFERAAAAVFIAMVFDGLDGRVARWTHTESAFGKEYDSLSDMVAFGVAPAIVVYQWGVGRAAEYSALAGQVGWLVTFFYAVAAALRLARFNTRTAFVDKRYFEGLPSPSAAAVVAAAIWCAAKYSLEGPNAVLAAFVLTGVSGLLMVSRFYYWSFKGLESTDRLRFQQVILVPLAFVLIAVKPEVVLLVFFGLFAASAPVIWLVRKLRRRPGPAGGTR